ncbi:unnamed protein product [Nezara viridula]|uniref:Uncharacterized protein n=1 Tax=Nezara viridula TaxID=85310 RepID=A0A9P0MJ31_NEZVI|nr:unnamed protein product [Nezara viridula]
MSSDIQQQFCLRWNNYQNSLLSSLPQLLDGDDLTDVTLYAGGRSIKAHRIVLSACSQYFKNIFKEMSPLQHPVIVVPGTDFTELCALVTFMYSGEVNIYQHQLPGLIALADTLHIRGLAQFSAGPFEEEGFTPQSPPSTPQTPEEKMPPLGIKRPKLNENNNNSTSNNNNNNSTSNNNTVAPSPVKSMYVRKPKSRGTRSSPGRSQGEAEDLSRRDTPTDLTQDGGGGNRTPNSKLYATCLICGKQLSNQYNLRVHMETHQNAHYACSSCSHVSRSRDALRKHVSYRHPQPPPPDLSAATPPGQYF